MTEESNPNIIAALDQFQAHALNVSVIVASYYEKLIDEGIPEKLASELTVAFQDRIWNIASGGSSQHK